ncbi:MAG TPA: cobalamin B12-binding domain-containing protein [Deltaproteobacteria bacterium]|nr:cobalamin B12-binding domain-containing protein [Deltaproteobacteria bacterium]
MGKQSIRVLLAKPGLDGHDRGAKFLARALRDAGMEVIYTGLHQKIPQIVVSAMQEDVEGVGLSILCGSYLRLTEKFLAECKKRGLSDPLVLVGGTIAEDDYPKLKEMGVDGIFGVETDIDDIIKFIREHVQLER